MIWLKNLLFIGLVIGGGVALVANLMPPREVKAITSYDAHAYSDPGFRSTVERVNDSFRQQWASEGLKPARPAADLLIARRLALGLVGAVPSLEEIRQIESLPPAERMPWWLDHLLQDRRFSDYFAERFARAYVGTEDGPFIFFRRRRFVTWLEESLVKNRPYDEIVRDLIDDTGLWTDKPATNFVSVTCQQDKGNQPDPVRLAGRVTRAFLGIRIDCAQCHNHPFASWKQTDFEGLSAFFGQTHVGFKGIHDGKGEYQVEDRKTQEKKTVAPHVPFNPELLPDQGTRRQQLANWVTHPGNPFFARAAVNRVWALVFGRSLVEPVDNLETDGPIPAALQILADDFVAHRFDLRRLIRVIASTDVFRIDSAAEHELTEAQEKAWAVFPLTRLRPEQVAGSIIQAASVATIDAKSNILVRLAKFGQQSEFVTRYGDSGEDEFDGRGGTIPQRLILMNGKMPHEKIKNDPANASTRIAMMAADDTKAIEVAYLTVLTRRPTPSEAADFELDFADKKLSRAQILEDLYWVLINGAEFSWNH
jgi:Protein of unknown function (DUF1553)/Protein of unknown function (DUF1549)